MFPSKFQFGAPQFSVSCDLPWSSCHCSWRGQYRPNPWDGTESPVDSPGWNLSSGKPHFGSHPWISLINYLLAHGVACATCDHRPRDQMKADPFLPTFGTRKTGHHISAESHRKAHFEIWSLNVIEVKRKKRKKRKGSSWKMLEVLQIFGGPGKRTCNSAFIGMFGFVLIICSKYLPSQSHRNLRKNKSIRKKMPMFLPWSPNVSKAKDQAGLWELTGVLHGRPYAVSRTQRRCAPGNSDDAATHSCDFQWLPSGGWDAFWIRQSEFH